MAPKYSVGQKLDFLGQSVIVKAVEPCFADGAIYLCAVGDVALPMRFSEGDLAPGRSTGTPPRMFKQRIPHLLVVDDFYEDPDHIRAIALVQHFGANERFYKGRRTAEHFLWPHLREEFERLVGVKVVDWLQQSANGCFQITGFEDPLVWHSDQQSVAAAIYLTPDAPIGAGTSFWRDRIHGVRRPPTHPLEAHRFGDEVARAAAVDEIYTANNVVHADNWELVDRVGAVYNRLVIWDAQLIHSASSYQDISGASADSSRLVQLFFFNIA